MKTMVYTFGRFQPPTKAHVMLVDQVVAEAAARNADHAVLISHTLDNVSNPLDWQSKYNTLKIACPTANLSGEYRTPFAALEGYGKLQYEKVVLVVGSDRTAEFEHKMSEYTTRFGIKSFEVISSGERHNGFGFTNGFDGISGFKTRSYVRAGNFTAFSDALPGQLSLKEKTDIYNKIRCAILVDELL